jgi:hypothetical protein
MSSKTIASRPTMRKVCKRKGEETFAGTHGSDGVAPIPDSPALAREKVRH